MWDGYKKNVRWVVTLPIVMYQKTLSYDHGPMKVFFPYGYCPFYPSCSEYAVRSVKKYGVIKGFMKAFFRLVRCHPFTKGGVDQP